MTINADDISSIRGLTRLALPKDDTYLYRLGVALYGFASISSFMAEVCCHLDSVLRRTTVEESMGGQLLGIFKKSIEKALPRYPEIKEIGESAAAIFETLNGERSDIFHAYPITSPRGDQILHRRKDKQGKYFEVTNEFLENFISRLHEVSVKLYGIRDIVKSR